MLYLISVNKIRFIKWKLLFVLIRSCNVFYLNYAWSHFTLMAWMGFSNDVIENRWRNYNNASPYQGGCNGFKSHSIRKLWNNYLL